MLIASSSSARVGKPQKKVFFPGARQIIKPDWTEIVVGALPPSLVRTWPGFPITVRQNELLNAFAGIHFAGIDIPARIHGDRIDPMELPRHTAVVADGARDRAGHAVVDPDLVIGAVDDEHVLLLRVMGKREVVNGSAHAEHQAAGSPALRPAGGRRGMHEEAADELSLLGEDLHAIAAALADVDQ